METHVARLECCVCTRQWVGILPEDADPELATCPNCGEMDSNLIEYLGDNMMGRIARGDYGEVVEYLTEGP